MKPKRGYFCLVRRKLTGGLTFQEMKKTLEMLMRNVYDFIIRGQKLCQNNLYSLREDEILWLDFAILF